MTLYSIGLKRREVDVKIEEVALYVVEIPFKEAFKHSLAERRVARNVIVAIRSSEGFVGYGEALPREYVTGESIESVLDSLEQFWVPSLWDQDWEKSEDVEPFLAGWHDLIKNKYNINPDNSPSARCSIELSLLDILGKFFKVNASSLIGMKTSRDKMFYSGVLSSDSLIKMKKKALLMRLFNFQQIKLKVGSDDDLDRVKKARSILGAKRDLRVDANGAWSLEEAREKIKQFQPYGVSAIEQPLSKNDIKGYSELTQKSPIPIIADESFCCLEDAKLLFESKGCDILNIRLSKCGGLYLAHQAAQFASQVKLGIQLGCQVGETAILSSAGRIFAQCHPEIKYLEGSYERFLLKQDIAKKRVRFHYGGKAKPILGPGLGIEIDSNLVESLAKEKVVFRREGC